MAMLNAFANPHRFMKLSAWLAPVLYVGGFILLAVSLWQGLWVVPKDEAQGGDIMRALFVHVPMAWLSLSTYAALAISSFVWFIWRHELADTAARAIAPIATVIVALCLITGSIWGRPTWGVWWEPGDARLNSMLFLFFILLGYLAIRAAMQTRKQAAMAGAILAMVGAVNLPLIKFSVEWFNSLHQDASITIREGSSLADVYHLPLFAGYFGFWMLCVAMVLTAMRTDIWQRQAARLRARKLEG